MRYSNAWGDVLSPKLSRAYLAYSGSVDMHLPLVAPPLQ